MLIRTACERCGEIFEAHSFRARYHSDACRKAASRERAKAAAAAETEVEAEPVDDVTAQSESPEPFGPATSMYRRTLDELTANGKEGTALALGALYLAQQLDMLVGSPGALPGQLVVQHAAALARALGGSGASGTGATTAGNLANIIGGAGGLVALRGGRS